MRLLANEVIPDGPGKGTVRMTNVTEVLDMNGFNDTINGLAGSGGAGNWAGTLDNTAAGSTSVLTVGDDFGRSLPQGNERPSFPRATYSHSGSLGRRLS